jgi:hypothetical protein
MNLSGSLPTPTISSSIWSSMASQPVPTTAINITLSRIHSSTNASSRVAVEIGACSMILDARLMLDRLARFWPSETQNRPSATATSFVSAAPAGRLLPRVGSDARCVSPLRGARRAGGSSRCARHKGLLTVPVRRMVWPRILETCRVPPLGPRIFLAVRLWIAFGNLSAANSREIGSTILAPVARARGVYGSIAVGAAAGGVPRLPRARVGYSTTNDLLTWIGRRCISEALGRAVDVLVDAGSPLLRDSASSAITSAPIAMTLQSRSRNARRNWRR